MTLRAAQTGLAGLAVLAAAVGVAGPAQAAPVPLSSRTFSATIDAPASWERENGCSQTEKKGPRKLRKLLLATYGSISSNILRRCSAADSGHEEGRALDWMVSVRDPAQKEIAESYLGWLAAPDEFGNPAAMGRRLGVSYVIWNNQAWRPATGTWITYRNCDKRKMRFKKYDNTCHRNHIHTSFSWDGALGRTSFYSGYVACPAPVVPPWRVAVPAVLPASPEVVPIDPARVLKSSSGTGLTTGPCRVHPDVRLDVPVLGVGTVPLTGVAAVTVRVVLARPDAAAELRVWTGGTAMPAAPALIAERRQRMVATVTVPVATDGIVSLQVTGGMGHLVADVTGYSVGVTT